MKVLFVTGGNNPAFPIAPFIRAQGASLEKEGVTVGYYPVKGKGLMGYLRHVRPLKRQIRQDGYDIIHAHYAFCGWLAWLAAPQKPLVVSLMGSDTYGSVNRQGKRTLRSIPVLWQSKLLNLFADALIVKSSNLMKYVWLKKKATLIPNGVDYSMFKPGSTQEAKAALGLDNGRKHILFAGNPEDPRKNFLLAKEAVDVLTASGTEVTLHAPYPIPHHMMQTWYNAADLLLSTSWLEGSPNVIKEALACNCPVVATPAGDTATLLSGVEACAVAVWHPEELAKSMQRVLGEESRSNGRECIAELEEGHIARRVIEVYRQAYSKRS